MTYRSVESMIRDVVQRKTEKGQYTTLEHAIRRVVTEEKIENDPNDQISAGSYKTKHFDYSPEANKLFSKLPRNTDPNRLEQSAVLHDRLFGIMKLVKTQGGASREEHNEAKRLVDRINLIGKSLRLKHPYLDKELKDISSLVGKEKDASKTLPKEPTGDLTPDSDVDNKSFAISRQSKMQKKIKIIDDD